MPVKENKAATYGNLFKTKKTLYLRPTLPILDIQFKIILFG